MNTEVEVPVDSEIVFYCKKCSEVVEADRIGQKYVYKCKTCSSKEIVFGTYRSIKGCFMKR